MKLNEVKNRKNDQKQKNNLWRIEQNEKSFMRHKLFAASQASLREEGVRQVKAAEQRICARNPAPPQGVTLNE